MNIIKKIIKAITPRGNGISAGHLEAAFYFGIIEFVITDNYIIHGEATLSMLFANIAALFLVIVSANYIARGIKTAQLGNRYNELKIAMLENKLEAPKEEVFKKCDCELVWGHTGRHAPHKRATK